MNVSWLGRKIVGAYGVLVFAYRGSLVNDNHEFCQCCGAFEVGIKVWNVGGIVNAKALVR